MPVMGARNIAFDAIADLNGAAGVDAILGILRRVGDSFGYENFCIAGIPQPGEKLEPYLMLSGWPHEWLELYTGRDYIHIDPVIAKLRTTTLPFEWREAPYDTGRGSQVALMMNEARELGLAEGLSVPIYSVSGFQAAVTFGAKSLTVGPDLKGALHLIAIYAHSRLRTILAGTGNVAAAKATSLSPREIECLKWSAEGKTAWEISCILSLQQRTVEHYLASAAHKMNAANRVHAIAQAFRARILH